MFSDQQDGQDTVELLHRRKSSNNIFNISSIAVIGFAIVAHGLAMAFPYWSKHVRSVYENDNSEDVIVYRGLYRECTEYYIEGEICLAVPIVQTWLTTLRYLAAISMGILILALGADILAAFNIIRSVSEKLATVCSISAALLILAVTIVFSTYEHNEHYTAFYFEIAACGIAFISGALLVTHLATKKKEQHYRNMVI